ncbi:MAG: phosphate signaling complex protein PhoU [Bacteroidetes bacterium]|jgi:phosphate transport system protein|nr:phosphate signaling complex protein PhoU [Bacteroidota bacterium]
MKHNQQEVLTLKEDISQMWRLVISQVEKAKQSLLHNDIETALEIIRLEKRVDAFELKIERSCENYIALFNPVAIDLRLILSIMKISITLERIADYAEGIAKHIIDNDCAPINQALMEELQLEKMFEMLLHMMSDSYVALSSESTRTSGKILMKDKEVNAIYHAAFRKLEAYLTQNPSQINCGLKLILLIRKMERIGDHCSNIVEEIVFYLDAKVLKHKVKSE